MSRTDFSRLFEERLEKKILISLFQLSSSWKCGPAGSGCSMTDIVASAFAMLNLITHILICSFEIVANDGLGSDRLTRSLKQIIERMHYFR